MFGIPRWLVVASIILIAAIEVVFRVPDILLIRDRYVATKAELAAKAMQADLTRAQLDKARLDAQGARWQVEAAEQEARASHWKAALIAAQAMKAEAEASAATFSPNDLSSAQRLNTAFDLLDPNMPSALMKGLLDPTPRLVQKIVRSPDYVPPK